MIYLNNVSDFYIFNSTCYFGIIKGFLPFPFLAEDSWLKSWIIIF